ncbi:hypothetical protein ACLOJK_035306 [Asimina triloba]
MTENPSRRILTSSAVRPCEGISPTTLLRALVAICRGIVDLHRTKSFPSHSRNAREAAREAGILLLFFQEILDGDARCLRRSAALGFSELYVALQKIRCLLEDCARNGARLWILMRSERVTEELRVLVRSVATALEVLPLASIDVSPEIREMVELVRLQAQKVRIETDPMDEKAAKVVVDVLGGFENRIDPDLKDLKWVLDRLEIRSWGDCNSEIQFLVEEMESRDSEGDGQEAALFSSLLGLMCYCRAVAFDDLDGKSSNEKKRSRCDGEDISALNPEDFKCPITLELMKDPVTVATGQTYDRESILKWFKAGHLNCPKTGEKLMNRDMIPNSAVSSLIQKFCRENGIPTVEPRSRRRESGKTQFAGSPVAAEAMRKIAAFLVEKLSTGTEAAKNKAAYEIRLLAKTNVFNRSCLVEAGAISGLLNLLSSSNPTAQENAVAALLNLSKHPNGKTEIFELGGLGKILEVLSTGLKMEARQNAAAVLFYLSSVERCRRTIGETPEAFPALVGLLQEGSDRGKKNASVALFGLLQFPGNHQRVLAAGAVPPLLNLLTSERLDLAVDSLAVLASLAECPEGTLVIVRASAIPLLVGYLHSSSSRTGNEYCVSTLLSLAINGGSEVGTVLQSMPSLIGILYSVLTGGSSRASKKARILLSLLHGGHHPGASAMSNPTVRQERAAVRVR